MTRILDWPIGLHPSTMAVLSGPRTVGGASTESISGYVQTSSRPGSLWRLQFGFPALRGTAARRYRGLITALHGGVNMVPVPLCDPDGLPWARLGVNTDRATIREGMPWSVAGVSLPWAHGKNWRVGRPWGVLIRPAARDTDRFHIAPDGLGAVLDVGDQIGFAPLYFGFHTITERFGPGDFRIWPPLRADRPAGSYQTFSPVLMMRLESESGAPYARGISGIDSPSMTMIEVEDRHVRLFHTR